MKRQKVVRTYPNGYTNQTTALVEALSQGWTVVMSNPFHVTSDKKGTEYILERESEK